MNKFKTGDRVRIIKDDKIGFYQVGAVGTVTRIDDLEGRYYVSFDNTGLAKENCFDNTWCVEEEEMELIVKEEEKGEKIMGEFSVGETVVVTKSGMHWEAGWIGTVARILSVEEGGIYFVNFGDSDELNSDDCWYVCGEDLASFEDEEEEDVASQKIDIDEFLNKIFTPYMEEEEEKTFECGDKLVVTVDKTVYGVGVDDIELKAYEDIFTFVDMISSEYAEVTLDDCQYVLKVKDLELATEFPTQIPEEEVSATELLKDVKGILQSLVDLIDIHTK